jgi:hypothetical protein
MNRIWGASYPRGMRLCKAGCSLPYLDALPGKALFRQRALYVNQLNGYFESYVIDFGMDTAYVIALRIGTDRAGGAIVVSYDLVLPWPDHEIEWGYDPRDLLPKHRVNEYGRLVESRLPAVLDERRLLSRGRPVEGLVCGYAWTPIPASCLRDRSATAEIVLVDDSDRCARSPVQLTICSLERRTRVKQRVSERQPIFDGESRNAYDEVAEGDLVLQDA